MYGYIKYFLHCLLVWLKKQHQTLYSHRVEPSEKNKTTYSYQSYTVDSRYLEVDGTTEIIRLTRSSTQRN